MNTRRAFLSRLLAIPAIGAVASLGRNAEAQTLQGPYDNFEADPDEFGYLRRTYSHYNDPSETLSDEIRAGMGQGFFEGRLGGAFVLTRDNPISKHVQLYRNGQRVGMVGHANLDTGIYYRKAMLLDHNPLKDPIEGETMIIIPLGVDTEFLPNKDFYCGGMLLPNGDMHYYPSAGSNYYRTPKTPGGPDFFVMGRFDSYNLPTGLPRSFYDRYPGHFNTAG